MILEQALGRHIAAAAQEDLEHGCFARREGARRAFDEYLAPFGVERDIAEGQQLAQKIAWTTQQRLQARHQLLHREWLGEIIVGASRRPVTRSVTPSRAVSTSTGVASPLRLMSRNKVRPSSSGKPKSSTMAAYFIVART